MGSISFLRICKIAINFTPLIFYTKTVVAYCVSQVVLAKNYKISIYRFFDTSFQQPSYVKNSGLKCRIIAALFFLLNTVIYETIFFPFM